VNAEMAKSLYKFLIKRNINTKLAGNIRNINTKLAGNIRNINTKLAGNIRNINDGIIFAYTSTLAISAYVFVSTTTRFRSWSHNLLEDI
jgi:hypothetical protein